jgi:hypothetical protein
MKFTVGDLVVLKRTGEEGHITAIVDKRMVEVDVKGTVFPVHVEDVDHPYLEWFTNKELKKKKKAALPEQLPVEKVEARRQRMAKGVYLSFMPVFKIVEMEEIVDELKIYILNELPYNIKFRYDMKLLDKSEFTLEGGLHAFGNIYLHSISYTDMNDQPRFNWTLKHATDEKMGVADGVLRIRPAKLFEHITRLLEHSEPTFSYLLIEDFEEKKKPAPNDLPAPPSADGPAPLVTSRTLEVPKNEIDLHIEALVGSPRGMSNAEILKIQLDALQRYLNLAVVHHLDRMIIIHGLGKGTLREEVHAVLKRTPEVARFKNEWSGKYGFGATEVFFRR